MQRIVEPKRALVKRGAALRIAAVIITALALSGCGAGNIKDLLKDTPTQKEMPAQ